MKNNTGRKSTVILFLAVLFSAINACGAKNGGKYFEASFYSRSGYNVELNLVVDSEGRGGLYRTPDRTEKLAVPSESARPWTAFGRDGSFLVIPEDTKNTGIVYGTYYYTNIVSNGVERTIAAFAVKGNEAKAMGCVSKDGTIFMVGGENEPELIGECSYQRVTLGEETRTVNAFRLRDRGDKWSFVAGDKIYRIEKDGKTVQTGWLEWRQIVPESGEKLIIIMTRGMGKNSKWAGWYDGVLYTDR
ncbi:MAG: hypothetical protein JW874_13605 [Spirochaetales bacterium]|nr:hypothetical protein [Spirochaetales bacterium]